MQQRVSLEFDYSALDAHVEQRYRALGWAELTPIQSKSYRLLLRGKSALLVAPTGSGKTEAAVISIFARLASRPSSENSGARGVRMLYVTPLRALNRDIFRRLISYAEAEGLKADIRHGDTSSTARAKMLASPPDILITTPETLGILLVSRKFKLHLAGLECIVIDELHELLGNERGSHLMLSLERLQRIVTKNQEEIMRVGLSATVGDPEEAAKFLVGKHGKCAIVTDVSARGYDVSVKYVNGNLAELANGILEYIGEQKGMDKSTLVFTNTRDEAEFLGAVLKAKSPSIPVEVHHGSLSKESRETTEGMLRSGSAGIVVCTSSLELGLDIGAVNLVVQVGSPRQATKLIQRIGRSRHKMRVRAVGALITNKLDEELEGVALIERMNKSSLESVIVHKNPLDVVAHHIAGLALEESSITTEKILEIFRQSYPFYELTIEDVVEVASILERQGIIRFDGEFVKRRGIRTIDYYFSNISTIPDIQQFDVIDITTKKIVGRLDQVFVGEYGEPGKPFVLKGNSWRIVSIDDDNKTMHVEPMFRDLSTIPYWVGELIPVEFETSQIVGGMRREIASKSGNSTVSVSKQQKERLERVTRELQSFMPDERTIIIERKKASSTIVVHSCLGTKVNQTLATTLSTLLSAKIGYLVETKSDSYRIVLSTSGALDSKLVETAMKEDVNLEDILQTSIVGTHPLNWKTWYVGKKFGIVDKSAQYDRRAARLIQDRFRGTALYREILRELFQEKYDIEKTREVIGSLRSGRIKSRIVDVDDYSELARPILEFASNFAALPLSMEKAILDLVKERLGNVKHKLLCLSCGRYESVVKTSDVREPIVCPLCHSRLITETYSSDIDLPKIIQKKKAGLQLSEEEDKKFRRAWKTSSLIQNFGKRAITILSGFGVGVDTAARIIRRTGDEDQFYRNIYLAEKNYVATRGFWQD
ncbi:MAG TPA: DEAD/DEAH box helicase [Nitrososphaerales archaeon]|nr:DEAD/DEAH box helicase [Nitrososphaerales archaeon]